MAIQQPEKVSASGYVESGGLNMYYEIHGTGEPLVFLHGGLTTIESSFGAMLTPVSKCRQLILFEQQGHGRTADIDRPLDFTQMADDTAAAIRHLDLGPVDVFGYSDGGNVALGLAVRHPDLIRKLGLASVNFNNDGLVPGMLDMMAGASAEDMPDELKDAYTSVAPRLEDWPVLVQKVMTLATSFPGWSIEQLQRINAPSLVLVGDSDIVRTEHAVELFRALPNARLAVLPGTGHDLRLEQPDLLLMILGEFFDAEEDDDS